MIATPMKHTTAQECPIDPAALSVSSELHAAGIPVTTTQCKKHNQPPGKERL
jgi:hypothetical protein